MANYTITKDSSGVIIGSNQWSYAPLGFKITTTVINGKGSDVSVTVYAPGYTDRNIICSLRLYINGTKVADTSPGGSVSGNNLISGTKRIEYIGSHDKIEVKVIPNYTSTFAGTGWRGDNGANDDSFKFAYKVPLETSGTKPTAFKIASPTTQTLSEKTTSISVTWSASTSYNNTGNYILEVKKNSGSWSVVKSDISWSTRSYSYSISSPQGNTYQFRMKAKNNIGETAYDTSGIVTINKLNAPTIGTIPSYNPYTASAQEIIIPLSGGSQTNNGTFKRKAKITIAKTDGTTATFSCVEPSSNNNTSVRISMTKENIIKALGITRASGSFTVQAWIENSNGSKSSTVSKSFTINISNYIKPSFELQDIVFSGGAIGYEDTIFLKSSSSKLHVQAPIAVATETYGLNPTITYRIESTSGFSSTSDVLASGAHFEADIPRNKDGIFTITVTALDSRGSSVSKTKKYIVQYYHRPIVKIGDISSAVAEDEQSRTVNVTLNEEIANIHPIQYSDDGNISLMSDIELNHIKSRRIYVSFVGNNTPQQVPNDKINGNVVSIEGLDPNIKYEILISETDFFNWVSEDYRGIIPTIAKPLSVRRNNVGINCIPQTSERGLEVNGNILLSGIDTGLKLTDKNNTQYNGLYDNKNSLLIGFSDNESPHHAGNTKISTGYNGTKGNPTIYVNVPNENNNGSAEYSVLHSGNIDDFAVPKMSGYEYYNGNLDNVDLNKTVMYFCNDATGVPYTGSSYGWLFNFSFRTNNAIQIYRPYQNLSDSKLNNLYIREHVNGAWMSWKSVGASTFYDISNLCTFPSNLWETNPKVLCNDNQIIFTVNSKFKTAQTISSGTQNILLCTLPTAFKPLVATQSVVVANPNIIAINVNSYGNIHLLAAPSLGTSVTIRGQLVIPITNYVLPR